MKRKFTRDEIYEADPSNLIEQSSWKWGTDDDYVIEWEGSHWLVTIRSSTTEGWCDDQWPVEGVEVELRSVTVEKWVPKEA